MAMPMEWSEEKCSPLIDLKYKYSKFDEDIGMKFVGKINISKSPFTHLVSAASNLSA